MVQMMFKKSKTNGILQWKKILGESHICKDLRIYLSKKIIIDLNEKSRIKIKRAWTLTTEILRSKKSYFQNYKKKS